MGHESFLMAAVVQQTPNNASTKARSQLHLLQDHQGTPRISTGEIPSFKLIETEYTYSFLDIQPTTENHILIIPKYHGAKLHDIPDEYLADLLPVTKRLVKALGLENDGPDGPGYNILQNNGRIAHQEVDHVHFHLIPKRNKDSGLIVGWPAQPTDFAKLEQLHKELLARLEADS